MPSPKPVLTESVYVVPDAGVALLTDTHPTSEVGPHHYETGDAMEQVHAPFDGWEVTVGRAAGICSQFVSNLL